MGNNRAILPDWANSKPHWNPNVLVFASDVIQ